MNKFFKAASSAAVLYACVSGAAVAHEAHLPAPADHAPIGVMGDHRHGQGEWMFSYRYMNMTMEGLEDQGDPITPMQLNATYGNMVAPVEMEMDMHMFGVMYGLSDQITLAGMVPYVEKQMRAQMIMSGMRFKTEASGIGDASVMALVGLGVFGGGDLMGRVGLSLPTGSIDERDTTPMMANALLPYPMQLGSGTYDAKFGLGWTKRNGSSVFGFHYNGLVRIGENDEDYALGDMHMVTGYMSHELSPAFSISGRLTQKWVSDIDGADARLNPMMTPAANPSNYGGTSTWLGFGANYVVPKGHLKNHRFAAELEAPIHNEGNGVGLAPGVKATLGWQYAF